MPRMLKNAVIVGAAALLVTGALTSPASAATVISMSGGYGEVNNARQHVFVCDTKANNRGVRIEYYHGTGIWDAVGDANGSASGCGSRDAWDGIYSIRMCESDTGGGNDVCTSWRNVP